MRFDRPLSTAQWNRGTLSPHLLSPTPPTVPGLQGPSPDLKMAARLMSDGILVPGRGLLTGVETVCKQLSVSVRRRWWDPITQGSLAAKDRTKSIIGICSKTIHERNMAGSCCSRETMQCNHTVLCSQPVPPASQRGRRQTARPGPLLRVRRRFNLAKSILCWHAPLLGRLRPVLVVCSLPTPEVNHQSIKRGLHARDGSRGQFQSARLVRAPPCGTVPTQQSVRCRRFLLLKA